MLGKPLGVAFAIALAFVACAHNVAQDSHTGEDGKTKGAKPMTLDNGEGKAKGVVTYPGGDRIDWKMIEVPDGKRGTLDFKLTWLPPRPGLQLAFDVFDEWNDPLVVSKASAKKKSRSRTREAQLENAKGKFFVRVYAVGRGDAGTYKLTVDFKETAGPVINDVLKLDINDPPKLAAFPEEAQPCPPFDVKNPACQSVCPDFGAPQGWPACKDKCPTPPSVDVASCLPTMPCPNPPDERVAHCKATNWPPCPDKNNPDLANPNCRVPLSPVYGRIVKNTVNNGVLTITISGGTEQGIKQDKGWTAKVLTGGEGDHPLPGGDVSIIRVAKSNTLGTVKLSPDQIESNPRVKFYPPAR